MIPLDVLRQPLRASLGDGPAAALHQDLDRAHGDPQRRDDRAVARGRGNPGLARQNEPPDCYYTLRESLDYAYLAQGQYPQAKQVFTADLKNHRGSGRSLNGLKTSLEEQRKPVPAWVTAQPAGPWRHATVSAAP